MDNILNEIKEERQRQKDKAFGGDTDAFDRINSRNDWVAYVTNYAGFAATTAVNDREDRHFRDTMLKVATIAVAAIEAYDKGYC